MESNGEFCGEGVTLAFLICMVESSKKATKNKCEAAKPPSLEYKTRGRKGAENSAAVKVYYRLTLRLSVQSLKPSLWPFRQRMKFCLSLGPGFT